MIQQFNSYFINKETQKTWKILSSEQSCVYNSLYSIHMMPPLSCFHSVWVHLKAQEFC